MKLIRRGTRPKLAEYAIYQGWNIWLVNDDCPGPPPEVAELVAMRLPHNGEWMIPDIPAGMKIINVDGDGNLSVPIETTEV